MSMPPPPQHPQQHPQPPHGPPPGYQVPPQQGPPQQGPPPGFAGGPTQALPPQPKPAANRALQLVWALGLVSVLCVILGLSLDEDGANQWDSVNAWGGLAIAGAALTLTPAVGAGIGLTGHRAWQLAACGAGALVLFWVLFTLPSVGSNMSLLTSIGIAAGVISVWVAPGRDAASGQRGSQHQPW